jgi:hypothetical protein
MIDIFAVNVSSQRALNADSTQRLFIPLCRTAIAQRSIVYNGPNIWNTVVIPNKLNTSKSSASFRKQLKSHLLS